ncbi:MAG: DUF262 domain-containing protein [Dehalococcoidia bacterium]|nr:DUF262 domain-containing protein [Dehalococcoidia bacterium]
MSNLNREIESEVMKINTFVEEKLSKDKILIPTFQREFVWEPENIRKLWDSIFNFYPIGSILYWVTDSYLHTHRKLGGFEFPHDEDTVRRFREWTYILDGQQRATSLLVSILGGKGKVKDDENFDYTLYFDATDATFFFTNELEKRKSRVNPAFLIRLKDVPRGDFLDIWERITQEEGINDKIKANIKQLYRIFSDYKLVLIRIQGVDVDEVCEIFERVNQEGKKLDPVDIIVARTYRNEDLVKGIKMFYLRDNLQKLKEILSSQGNRFQNLGDLSIIQMISICLRKEETGIRKSFGINPKALDNLRTEGLEDNWDICQKTIFETIGFLSDIKIHGPDMLPFGYLVFPLCYHFHKNSSPNRQFAKQWFWRTAFGTEDFRRADEVYDFCSEFFDKIERGEEPIIPQLVLSKTRLVQASYYYRSALSRAVLSFLAKQNPLDFSDADAEVLDGVYLLLSQAPNLHHIYPRNFLQNVEGLPEDSPIDSLMNICYLKAETNIKIGDKNPLHYFRKFESETNFDNILKSHLIPKEFIEKEEFHPEDYRDFLYFRAGLFCQKLKDELPDVDVEIVE